MNLVQVTGGFFARTDARELALSGGWGPFRRWSRPPSNEVFSYDRTAKILRLMVRPWTQEALLPQSGRARSHPGPAHRAASWLQWPGWCAPLQLLRREAQEELSTRGVEAYQLRRPVGRPLAGPVVGV